MGAELTHHLGYEKGDRNGSRKKKLKAEDGEMEVAVPRDREAGFEPQIIRKGQSRFDGFDDKIISMYARGMTVRGIQGHLKEMYGVEVSPELISRVSGEVMTELKNRGVNDLLITVVDGLKGFPEAVTSVFLEAQVQTCIVHPVRHSLKFVPWKERKLVAADLKAIYRARQWRWMKPIWLNSRPSGMTNTRPSAAPGGGTGSRSSSFIRILKRSEKLFAPPTPLRA